MKLTVLLLLIAVMQISAKSYSQTVTITRNNIPLAKVFREIHKQTGYNFLCTEEQLSNSKKVDIDLQKAPLKEVLDEAFKDQPLTYSIFNNTIIVTHKVQASEQETIVPPPIHITGVIKDSATGKPLAGVTIQLKGNTGGTVTDANGQFSMDVPDNAVLIVSYLGYNKREVAVSGRTAFNISLGAATTGLNQLVVVGYGTQKKVDLTGAVSTISGNVLADRPITNIGRGLQGQLPGLNITSYSGQPGQAATFNIRGFTSINGGSPYILVDGVPVSNLENINPNDILSVTVLKDAAAAAVYGSRAPFGVILITTKSGKKGTPKVNYGFNYAIHHITHLPDVVTDPYTVVTYKNEAYAGYYGRNLYDAFYTAYAKKLSQNPSLPHTIPDPNNPNNFLTFGTTNWFNELYQPDNPSFTHNISVSGGGDKIDYFFSGDYNKQTGVFRYNPDVFDRYNLRAKLDIKATKWLTFSTNSAYNRTIYNYPSLWTPDWSAGDLYHEIGREGSLAVLKNPDGSWTSSGVETGFLPDGGRGTTTSNEIQNTLGFTASFFNNTWRVKGDYTFRADNNFNRQYRVAVPYETGSNQTVYYAGHSDASNWANDINYQNINLYTEYENNFGVKNYFKAMVGFNQELNKYDYFSAQNNTLISSNVGYLDATTGTPPSVGGNGYAWALRGAFYRINYMYNNRYLLELDGRYDGSSRFPPGHHYGFFPSASAGWRISEEPFFEHLKQAINNLKIRASYGSLGNDQSLGNYSFIPTLGSGQASNILGGTQPTAVYPPNLVSPTITWEKVYSKDLGVDISLINKIDASFDAYRRDTKDMLTQGPQLPAVLGAGQPIANAANLKTLGWEFEVTYHDNFQLLQKPFKFNIRLNLWDNHSIITKFNNPNKFWFTGEYYTGEEIGSIWGLTTLGIFQSDAAAAKAPDESKLQGYYAWNKAGEIQYADLNHDGKIDYGDGTVGNPGDARVIGNTSPRYSFGGSGGFTWNNIDFNFVFQGIGKASFWPGTSGYYWSMFFAPWENVYKNIVGNTWTPQNPNAFYPSMKGWRAGDDGAWRDLAVPQTRYLYSAAYVRLKNVTIGYSLPETLLKKYGIDRIQIYVSGEDLWEYDKLPQGFDPEGLNGSWGAGKVYPFQRAYSFGANLSF